MKYGHKTSILNSMSNMLNSILAVVMEFNITSYLNRLHIV